MIFAHSAFLEESGPAPTLSSVKFMAAVPTQSGKAIILYFRGSERGVEECRKLIDVLEKKLKQHRVGIVSSQLVNKKPVENGLCTLRAI